MTDMKMTDQVAGMKWQDMKMTDQVAGHENARHENAGHENEGHENALEISPVDRAHTTSY